MSWDSKVHNLFGHCTSEAAFGGVVTHLPKIGPAQNLNLIWSDAYMAVNPEDGVSVMSSDPNVGGRLADLKTRPGKGDIIVRRTVRYIVRASEPDGEGGIVLVLEKEDCK